MGLRGSRERGDRRSCFWGHWARGEGTRPGRNRSPEDRGREEVTGPGSRGGGCGTGPCDSGVSPQAKYLAQIILVGAQVVGRAFMRALRQEFAGTSPAPPRARLQPFPSPSRAPRCSPCKGTLARLVSW